MSNVYLAFSVAVLFVLCGRADCSTASPKAKASNTAKADGGGKTSKPKLTNEQKRDILLAIAEFRKADSKDKRRELCRKIIDIGPGAPEMFSPVVDELLAGYLKQYAQMLDRTIREAYIKRLISLTDEQALQVQKMRRLWKDYVLYCGSRHDFQKQFLKPCWDVAEFLLIRSQDANDAGLAARRESVVEFIDYQGQCRTALGVNPDPDPTVGKVSPTGIALPNLDEPPTRMFQFGLLERTVALGAIAPDGARKVLLMNLESAREIDVQESEFTMYGNTVRILVGTIAWYVDPLVCAATRDHSADRKAGKASAHMSTIPGKEGFTDRLKRMGARWCGSEGAGGGRNGPDYIYGLSYGGGHTGPLYSLKRNVVGVGRRGGVYTSDYGTDNSLLHPCPATQGELFMPPGISRADVKSPVLQPIYNCLYTGDFGRAYSIASKAKVKDDFDKMLIRFFLADVTAEMDWFFQGAAAVEATGDVHELKRRLDSAKKAFGGIPAFDDKAEPIFQRLGGKAVPKELSKEFEAGRVYQTIARKIMDNSVDAAAGRKLLEQFIQKYPIVLCIGWGVFAAPAPALKKGPEPLTDEQKQDIKKFAADFRQAKTQGQRFASLRKIVAMGPEASMMASAAVDEALTAQEKVYFELLDKHVRDAYIKRLCMLSDEHIRKVQYMRRLWKDYLEHTSDQHEFQKNFLKPVWDVAEFLLVRPDQMTEPEIVKQRKIPATFYEKRVPVKTESSQWLPAWKRFNLISGSTDRTWLRKPRRHILRQLG